MDLSLLENFQKLVVSSLQSIINDLKMQFDNQKEDLGDRIVDLTIKTKEQEKTIKELSNRGINGIIIQILDPAERFFPYKGRINFNGLEGEKNILIGKAESVRNDYKKAIKIHIEKLEKLTTSYSWKYILDNSDQDASISLQNICNTLTYSNNTEFRT